MKVLAEVGVQDNPTLYFHYGSLALEEFVDALLEEQESFYVAPVFINEENVDVRD